MVLCKNCKYVVLSDIFFHFAKDTPIICRCSKQRGQYPYNRYIKCTYYEKIKAYGNKII